MCSLLRSLSNDEQYQECNEEALVEEAQEECGYGNGFPYYAIDLEECSFECLPRECIYEIQGNQTNKDEQFEAVEGGRLGRWQ